MNFVQGKSNSTIIIGEDGTAPASNRGIFEILGTGSNFQQSEVNSNITIACQQVSPTIAALYLDPETTSIATGSGFTIL